MKKALKIQPEKKSGPKSKVAMKPESTPEPMSPLLERWKPEIEALMSIEFASVEAACEALIERVAQKMSQSPRVREEMQQFLGDVFAMDPSLRESLREILSVKEK